MKEALQNWKNEAKIRNAKAETRSKSSQITKMNKIEKLNK